MDPNDQCPGWSDAGMHCRYLAGHDGKHSWQDRVCPAIATITGHEVKAELVCNLPEEHNGLHCDRVDGIVWDALP